MIINKTQESSEDTAQRGATEGAQKPLHEPGSAATIGAETPAKGVMPKTEGDKPDSERESDAKLMKMFETFLSQHFPARSKQ